MPEFYLSILLGLVCCCTISPLATAAPAPVLVEIEKHVAAVPEQRANRVKRYGYGGYGGGWGGGYPCGGFGYPGGGSGFRGGGFGYPGGGFGYPSGGFGSGFGSSFGLNARFSLSGFNNAFLGGWGK